MWSPLDSKLCDKGTTLSTTNDLDQWFLNLAVHLGQWLSTSILKNEIYVSVLWLGKKWETVIDKIVILLVVSIENMVFLSYLIQSPFISVVSKIFNCLNELFYLIKE